MLGQPTICHRIQTGKNRCPSGLYEGNQTVEPIEAELKHMSEAAQKTKLQ